MKKIHWKLWAILCACISIFAHKSADAQWVTNGIGPKFGLNMAKMRGFDKEISKPGYKFGFNLGVAMDLPRSSTYSTWIELIYTQQGTAFKTRDFAFRTHYLEVPVIARFYLGGGSVWKSFAGAGGSLSYMLGGGGKGSDSVQVEKFKRMDVKAIASVGAVGNLNYGRLLHIDLRYNYGFMNCTRQVSPSKGIKNSYISLNVAMTFPTSSKQRSDCPTFWNADRKDTYDENGNLKPQPLGAAVKYKENGLIDKKHSKQPTKGKKKVKIMGG